MIKSTLDLYRDLPKFLFEPEEAVIKKCSGTLDVGQYAFPVFRPCNIYLTDRRLLLAQIRTVIREFRYPNIQLLVIEKRKWIAGKMTPQLKIMLKDGRIYFVVMNQPQDFLNEIAKRGQMSVTKEPRK